MNKEQMIQKYENALAVYTSALESKNPDITPTLRSIYAGKVEVYREILKDLNGVQK